MLILTHIAFALLSLIQSTVAVVRPSRGGLRLSYGLVAATLASGVYLVGSTHAPIVSSCTTGLLYLATVSSLAALARRRLLN